MLLLGDDVVALIATSTATIATGAGAQGLGTAGLGAHGAGGMGAPGHWPKYPLAESPSRGR